MPPNNNKNASPLALYIHWPFCVSKCPYCDFNSHVHQKIEEDLWVSAYIIELERYREITGPRPLSSIFFGGGTPSLMKPTTVEAILKKAHQLWSFQSPIEITLEANPNSVEVEKFQTLSQVGINRVSIGIQSFHANDLKFLGRAHSVDEGKRAIETAQHFFQRVSFDLIYGRPQQSLDSWNAELQEALAFGTEHLSLYQLTMEPGTAFYHQHARGEFTLPNEDEAADLYDRTAQLCREKGLIDYEISNYARIGCESRHNLTYWRYQDYIGVGPGAHGRLTIGGESSFKVATRQYKAPQTWLEQAKNTQVSLKVIEGATQECLALNLNQQIDEMLLMGLRLKEPFEWTRLPGDWKNIIREETLESLKELRLIDFNEKYVKLFPSARLCLNEILRQLRG